MKKKVVSIFTTKWGHYSIGKAVLDSLINNKHFDSHLNNITVNKTSDLFYTPGYRLFPQMFMLTSKVAETKRVSNIITKYLNKSYKTELENLIKLQKPQFVINTYFAFIPNLEKLSKKFNFQFINIVHDPRTFNKMILSSIGYNFVFDNKTKKLCVKFGVNKDKLIVSGWFVQNKFYKKHKPERIKRKLGIKLNAFTIVAVGGSSGNYGILKSLPALISTKKNINLIYICGDNKNLFRSTRLISELFSSNKINIIPVGFTKEINKYLIASDLVIGKAGPNLIFETVAVRKPFIAVSHIYGQEDGNLDIIKEYELGYIEEKPMRLAKLLRAIIENPNKLKKFEKPIYKMAKNNKNSKNILLKFLEEKFD